MTSQAAINAEMSIPDIVAKYPATREVFERYGLTQIEDYKALQFETLLATSKVQQWDVPEVLRALNAAVH
ncbi:MAG: DUF1858 domain-containing protein [Vampirovibrionales bacterium]|nr:DUF1858 domain-containing protein [Vampirovibrionales bacterium]